MELKMLIGGTGTQAAPAPMPGLAKKTAWDAGSVSDFVGSNGAAISSDDTDSTTFTVTTNGTTTYKLVLASTTGITTDIYVALFDVDAANDAGYYEITSVTATEVFIAPTSLNGVDTMAVSDTVSYSIGGAGNQSSSEYSSGSNGSALEWANDLIGNDIDMDTYSVEVLYNISETGAGDTIMDASSSNLYKLVYTGCIYDDTVVGNNFQIATSHTDMPTLTFTVFTLRINSEFIIFRNIKTTSADTSYAVSCIGDGTLIQNCHITSTSAAGNALYCIDCGVSNCHLVSDSTSVTPTTATLRLARTFAVHNFICSKRFGIYDIAAGKSSLINNNIITSTGEASSVAGIYIDGADTIGYVSSVSNNTIHTFASGIYFDEFPSISDVVLILVSGNIIYGYNSGTSIGIENNQNGTYETTAYFNSNAIGNVTTAYDGIESNTIQNPITLSASPFLNAGGSYALASDFILNSAATGGALCANTECPNDLDLDGTQDTFGAVGALQADATTGGGGGFVQSSSGRFGIRES